MTNPTDIPRSDAPKGRQPDFHAFQVRDIDGREKGVFTRIGAAWAHKDGQGFDIRLDALPTDGRVALRKPRPPQSDGAIS